MTIFGLQLYAGPRLVRAVSMSGRYYTMTTHNILDTIYNLNDVNYIYIFDSLNNASFETINNEYAIWTEVPTNNIVSDQTNVFQNVIDGYCYKVTIGDKTESFVFIDYSLHRLDGTKIQSIDLDCQRTTIHYDPSLAMTYYTPSGDKKTLPYKLGVTYMNQRWDSASIEWKEVEITDSIEINTTGVAELSANLMDTQFELEEPKISTVLYDKAVKYTSDTLTAVAVEQRLQYYITKRGSMQENEKEGPYGTENLKATVVHSAPIDVLFEAHPSAKADVYNWTIKKGQTVVTARNDKDIRYTFDEVSESAPEYYYVNLVVRNSEHTACTDTGKVDFELHSSMLMVPNIFTPNGDGVNDEFRVAYRSICEFHCWVYNRWQHLVYQWDDPAKGWDGTYNGRKEPDSAYIYIIEAKGCDGQKYKLKGTVNLLRGK